MEFPEIGKVLISLFIRSTFTLPLVSHFHETYVLWNEGINEMEMLSIDNCKIRSSKLSSGKNLILNS